MNIKIERVDGFTVFDKDKIIFTANSLDDALDFCATLNHPINNIDIRYFENGNLSRSWTPSQVMDLISKRSKHV
jgi:hypothetical protein